MKLSTRIDAENLVFLEQVLRDLKSMGVELMPEQELVATAEIIYGRSRNAEIVFCRAVVAHYLRDKGLSLSRIGEYMGRDHATIINLLKYKRGRQAYDVRFDLVKTVIESSQRKFMAYDALIQYHANEIIKIAELKKNIQNGKE